MTWRDMIALALLYLLSAAPAHAETWVRVSPAQVSTGEKLSWIQCPCFRWVVQAQAGSGEIETRDFLISSDALLRLNEEKMMDLRRYAVRTTTLGAFEALYKGGHIGLGFKGITWGKDRDRGYSELLRTGLYGLINLVRTDSMRLDLRSGFDYQSMRVNLGPRITDESLDQAVALRVGDGRWSGSVTAHVSMDTNPAEGSISYGTAGQVALRIVDFHGLQLGTSLDLGYEHDGLREDLGFEPDLVAETVMMSLSYVAGER